MVITVPLLLPVGVVAAAYTPTSAQQVEEQSFNSTVTFTFNDKIVSVPAKTVSIEIVESVAQAKARASKKTVAVAVAKKTVTSTQTSDPGLQVKREWVQRAAASQGIDWKLLEAVWQIESGKRWYFTGGSSVGARGPCQFMLGTWRSYATDGNGDGVSNVYDARDCLYGSAKLLARNGAASGDHRRALLAYNHSIAYVNTVIRIMDSI